MEWELAPESRVYLGLLVLPEVVSIQTMGEQDLLCQ